MTHEQLIAIIHHLEYCEESAKIARNKFKDVRPIPGSNYVGNQYIYWKNVSSGLKWAKQLAIQMDKQENGPSCTQVQ